MREREQSSTLAGVSHAENSASHPSITVDDDLLSAQAMSLGLTPVRAFVLSADAKFIDASVPAIERAGAKRSNATRTANVRAAWRAKGFNQLVLVVPVSEEIRSSLRAIETDLKNGVSWFHVLLRDPAVASVVSLNEDLVQQLSASQKLLEKTQQELAEARLLAKPRSLLDISVARLGSIREILGSIFANRRYEAK